MVGVKDFFLSLITLGAWGLYKLLRIKEGVNRLRLDDLEPIQELVDKWGFIPQIQSKLEELEGLRRKYDDSEKKVEELLRTQEEILDKERSVDEERCRRIEELKNQLHEKEDLVRSKDATLEKLREEKITLSNQRDFWNLKNQELTSARNDFESKYKTSHENVIKLQSLNETLTKENGELSKEISSWQELHEGKTLSKVKEDKKREEEEIARVHGVGLNVNDSGDALEDWVYSELETISRGCLGQLKVQREHSISNSTGKSLRIDFLLSFYSPNESDEDFKMVLECKNTLSPTEKDISKKFYKQALEYARSEKAKFAVIVTTMNFDNKKEGYLLIDGTRWESIFGELQRSTDPMFYVICPTFLKSFIFLTLNVRSCFKIAKATGFQGLFNSSNKKLFEDIMKDLSHNLDQFSRSFSVLVDVSRKQRETISKLANYQTRLEKHLDVVKVSTLKSVEGGMQLLENMNSVVAVDEKALPLAKEEVHDGGVH
ncbi:hypothetical protein HF1_10930 [Mycoplasma haemofelis str. Langford 1]|uniref:Uncharacterized protein n=1 Tax=Mycoplasma haemofelis (strain Langford 1) TaxID=941640 RepID=E8ZIY0_MYCHL|nr:hypothetical protein [Mycoplasma haemofelis]CBY93101.1 hypothetical protein HF1_10930 [Mycoplasma haemofelis str. Langford 1]